MAVHAKQSTTVFTKSQQLRLALTMAVGITADVHDDLHGKVC
jgi:hypothetical protein